MRTTWKFIIPSCCRKQKLKNGCKTSVVRQSNTTQRLSFSDLSSPGTPQHLSASFIGSNLHIFTFNELRGMTHNFSVSNLLGEGGFGPVLKGFIDDKLRPGLEAQPVAVKLLDLRGTQGHKEWLSEVIFLGQLRHPHLVRLIGYCWEGEHRLLVYEYMTRGSLDNQLFRSMEYSAVLSWSKRIKIAVGAAKGLAFLHEADKPVIYRDFKASNILLDSVYTAKLSDFGLAKDGPVGDKTHVSTRIMGTHGYAAPEYIMTGHLTTMSDVYSFGVVLLELLTGKRSTDKCGENESENLIEWAKPILRDPQMLHQIVDPSLKGQFPLKGVERAAALAYRCLNHYPKQRPTMTVVVKTLENILENDSVLPTSVVYPDKIKNIQKASIKDQSGVQRYGYSPSPRWKHGNRSGLLSSSYSDGSLYGKKF